MFPKWQDRLKEVEYQIKRLRSITVRSEVTGAVQPLEAAALPTAGQAGRMWFVTDVLGGSPAFDTGTQILSTSGLASFTVAELNLLPNLVTGLLAFASDGCKDGESPAAGTGCPVYYDMSLTWRRFSDDVEVFA